MPKYRPLCEDRAVPLPAALDYSMYDAAVHEIRRQFVVGRSLEAVALLGSLLNLQPVKAEAVDMGLHVAIALKDCTLLARCLRTSSMEGP